MNRLHDLRSNGVRAQWYFVRDHRAVVRDHPDLALHFARLAVHRGDYESAQWALEGLPAGASPYRREFAVVEMLQYQKRFDDMLAHLGEIAALKPELRDEKVVKREIWRGRTFAYLGKGEKVPAVEAALSWADFYGRDQKRTAGPLLVLARGFRTLGMNADAATWYEKISEPFADTAYVMLEYAETLVKIGRNDKASSLLERIQPGSRVEQEQLEQLQTLAALPFVPYSPTLESAAPPGRKQVRQDDQVDVAPALPAADATAALQAHDAAAASRLTAAEVMSRLQDLKVKGVQAQWRFAGDHRAVVRDHPDLALQFARLAVHRGDYESAQWALESLPAGVSPYRREFAVVEMLQYQKRFDDMLASLGEIAGLKPELRDEKVVSREIWRGRTFAYLGKGEKVPAVEAALSWADFYGQDQKRAAGPLLVLARGFRTLGMNVDAAIWYEKISESFADTAPVMLEYAETLVKIGRNDQASSLLMRMVPKSPAERERLEKLRAQAAGKRDLG